jgi:hypothetical protein
VTQSSDLRIGPWATQTGDRIWRTLRRRRLGACEHLVEAAIKADVDTDLARLDGEGGGPGVALVPVPSLCAAHTFEVRCADCHAAHVAATHNPPVVRCHMCRALPALVRRHLDVRVVSPVRIWHAAVSARLGGALTFEEAMCFVRGVRASVPAVRARAGRHRPVSGPGPVAVSWRAVAGAGAVPAALAAASADPEGPVSPPALTAPAPTRGAR